MKIHIGKFFCAVAVVWLAGCAELKSNMPAWLHPAQGGEAMQANEGPRSLKDIASNLKGRTKLLWLNADGPFKYTTYMLGHPHRLVIEVAGMANSMPVSSILFDDDLLARISVVEFRKADSMRIEISLKHKAEYSLSLDGPVLTVMFTPPDEERDPGALADKLIMAQGRIKALTMENYRLEREVENLKDRLEADNIGKSVQKNRADITRSDGSATRRKTADQDGKLREAVTQWLTAWQAGDFEKYSGFYAETFMNTPSARKTWMASKRKKFGKAGSISVEIKNMVIEINGDKAVVQFIQMYRSNTYKDEGYKTLGMVRTVDGWKIESEAWRAQK